MERNYIYFIFTHSQVEFAGVQTPLGVQEIVLYGDKSVQRWPGSQVKLVDVG